MTALDQAFIKAFTRQESAAPTFSAPLPELPTAAKGNVPRRKAEESVVSRSVGDKPSARPVPVIAEIPHPVVNPTPTVSSLPSLSSCMASSVPVGDVWAALEKPSKSADALFRAKSVPAVAEPVEAVTEVGCESWTSDNGQWAVAAMQYLKDSEPEALEPEPEPEPELEREPELESEPELHVSTPVVQVPVVEPCVLKAEIPAVTRRDFKPAWQVSQFTWPRICRRLIAHAPEELDRLADALLAIHTQGQKVLAIGGCHQGEGATTMLLCAARRLAERGITLALVDADLARPRLAKQLGVQSQLGWNETTDEEGKTLDQAIVEAVANNAVLLPAREPSDGVEAAACGLSRLPGCLDVLRTHYDMVLVDLGPLEKVRLADINGIDAVVLVQNRRITSEEHLLMFAQKMAASNISVVGIVENFVLED